jgi:hypothetical protein
MLDCSVLVDRLPNGEKPADDPPYIGVYGWHRQSKRYAQDGPGRVSSNSWKAHEVLLISRDFAPKPLDNIASRRMEISRPGIVAHVFPRF